MVHKKLLKQIGLDLAYLKHRAPYEYESLERALVDIAKTSKMIHVQEKNRRFRMRLSK